MFNKAFFEKRDEELKVLKMKGYDRREIIRGEIARLQGEEQTITYAIVSCQGAITENREHLKKVEEKEKADGKHKKNNA